MIKNIKNLWSLMLRDTRREVMQAILNEKSFSVTDEIYITQTWIYAGKIPEQHQPKVVEIFQQALRTQIARHNKALAS